MADLQSLLERAAASPARPPDVAGPYRRRRRNVRSGFALVVVAAAATAGVAITNRSSGPDARVQVRAPKPVSTPKQAPTPYRDKTNRMSISIAPGWQRMPRALRPWLFSPHEILSLATTSLSPTPGPGNHAACASEIAQVVVDRIGPDGGYMSIDEWRQGQGIYTSEPRTLRAADLHWSALCPLPNGMTGQGATVHEAGRDFTISLVFGAHARATRRAELYAMLDTLHFDP
jgi:hypothetical protein